MAGTIAGGAKARETNKSKYGQDYYHIIGSAGGKAPYKGKKGFAANLERARSAGRIGGRISRRTKKG